MKIILSPSKLQAERVIFNARRPVMSAAKSQLLRVELTALSRAELKRFFGLKDKLVERVYRQIQQPTDAPCDVFGLYDGIVFKEINAVSYDANQLDYLKAHGVVLSALYGVLEADMAVRPYRLDMSKKLAGIDLYDFWQDDVDAYFKDVDIVVNLASREFSRMLKNYAGRMIDVHFVEAQCDGRHRVVTVRAKRARGLMFDYMVSQCLEEPEAIQQFCEAGYRYAPALSTRDVWYFVRPYDD